MGDVAVKTPDESQVALNLCMLHVDNVAAVVVVGPCNDAP